MTGSPIRMGGEGCFGESAELPKLKFDIYCPAMDISECKSPHRFNYLQQSCDDRLKNKLCTLKSCPSRNLEEVKYDRTHYAYGFIRTSKGRWVIYDPENKKIGTAGSLVRCREFVNAYSDTLGPRQSGG